MARNIKGSIDLEPSPVPSAVKGRMYYDSAENKFKGSTDGITFDPLGVGGDGTQFDKGNVTGAVNIDWDDGKWQKITATGEVTLTFLNAVEGDLLSLEIVQDATGSHIIIFPVTVSGEFNVFEQQSLTPNARDLYQFKVGPASDFQVASAVYDLQTDPSIGLPYYLEQTNGLVTETLWVKIPALPPSGTTVFTIQKNPGFIPDGEETFVFFDDFESGLDLTKWNIVNNGNGDSVQIVNGQLQVGNALNDMGTINAKQKVGISHATRWRGDFTVTSQSNHQTGFGHPNMRSKWNIKAGNIVISANDTADAGFNDYSPVQTGDFTDKLCEGFIFSDGSSRYTIDEGGSQKVGDIPPGPTVASDSTRAAFHSQSWDANKLNKTQWVHTRKILDTDPSVVVVDLGGVPNLYQVTVTNNTAVAVTDLQVQVAVADIGGVANILESLECKI